MVGTYTALSVSDGSTGAVLSHRMIEFTGSFQVIKNVTIPIDVQTFYFLKIQQVDLIQCI